ncbi:Nuclease-related domain-containing protein [Lysobacter sp. yr284]|uniref:nuclease-related domain-containing protein n=1 Tax=Lysobacter sp. yr284 TaxID=1761791 RepID=UPI000894C493|nr:nuclease-related domain-containing protein [Lysobacter sp. yr284]SDY89922.1 Nuclease-related domain-containing protein [Lysobacter sp. yr284]
MLIKTKDDDSALLKDLELRANGAGPAAKQAATELRIRQAGLKGERESAYLIDFHFERSPNWAVIHDLRLEQGGRVAQIDHLLINRRLEIYVLETKHFHAGFKITDDGEFLRWNAFRKTYEGMASPLEQNERHIAVLRDAVDSIEWPQRMGLRIAPVFHSLVLVAPTARIDRPKHFDSSRVIKADLLRKQIDKDFAADGALMGLLKTTAKLVSGDTVAGVARQLVAMHRPLRPSPRAEPEPVPHRPASAPTSASTAPSPQPPPVPTQPPSVPPALAPPAHRLEPTLVARITPPEPIPTPPPLPPPLPVRAVETEAPACKTCQGGNGEILYGKFGYYFKCEGCGGNTAIRFVCQPGHKPRLRKDGPAFYRECADCQSSALYHRNRA